jgi:outer membrane protein assembly factor BamB
VVALVAALALAHGCPAPQHDLVLLSARTGRVQRWVTDVRDPGSVLADGRGGWYLIGRAGACPSPMSIWHLRADGSLDPAFHAFPNAFPRIVSGRTLYVGSHYFVAALDARTGAVRWKTPVNGPVALALGLGRLYVGGGRHVLALSPRTGRKLPWHGPTFRPLSSVNALALSGGRLFVGGNLGAEPTLLAYSARTGRRLPWGVHRSALFTNGVGDVDTMLLAGGYLFTAGLDGFGITSARTGNEAPWVRRISGVASAFAAHGGVVYLGAEIRNSFDAIDGKPRHDLAAVELGTGRLLPFAPKLAKFVAVGSMAANGHSVLVAGSFTKSLG